LQLLGSKFGRVQRLLGLVIQRWTPEYPENDGPPLYLLYLLREIEFAGTPTTMPDSINAENFLLCRPVASNVSQRFLPMPSTRHGTTLWKERRQLA
jgi:hypothetical protein